MTDDEGKYSISVPANSTIAVSCIGYTTQTITIGSESIYNVMLQGDTQLLEETVVIGYGVQKKSDKKRGIESANGLFGHGPYFEWKHMVYINPPAILTKGKSYPADNMATTGPASNHKNFNVARYAEACIGSSDAAKGLAALNEVQERSGKISSELTLEAVMEEKQYEMWFENCRFHDIVRWSNLGKLDIEKTFENALADAPVLYDALFWEEDVVDGKKSADQNTPEAEHRFFVRYSPRPAAFKFEKGKHEYFPFPLDVTNLNPNLKSYGKWAN
ncbi:MAG: RagB/SusD family nutrient uptake outer membrane protein [Bacteroidales bacterium]|nr:RagB/SusD family nutrient uptake outer membrane protein [Bacteroidales bacterium]